MTEKIELEKLKMPQKNSESEDSEIFSDMQSERIDSLNETIQEIDDLIEERQNLSATVARAVEKVKTDIKNIMLEVGEKTVDMTEKVKLKQKEVDIDEFKIKETIDCWKDIARLKEERRTHETETKERESRLKLMNEVMEEN